MKKTTLAISLIIVSVFVVILITDSPKTSSQTLSVKSVNAKNANNRKMEVSSDFIVLTYNGEGLESFVASQPLPQVKISFENENVADLNLTKETTDALMKHWKILLRHTYLTKVLDFSSEIDYQKEDIILSQSVFDTKMFLTDLPVSTEYELGNYSSDQASEIIGVLRDSAKKIVEETDKIK